jgi:hypothetical protein
MSINRSSQFFSYGVVTIPANTTYNGANLQGFPDVMIAITISNQSSTDAVNIKFDGSAHGITTSLAGDTFESDGNCQFIYVGFENTSGDDIPVEIYGSVSL